MGGVPDAAPHRAVQLPGRQDEGSVSLTKVKVELPYDPQSHFHLSEEIKNLIRKNICNALLITALCTVAKAQSSPVPISGRAGDEDVAHLLGNT